MFEKRTPAVIYGFWPSNITQHGVPSTDPHFTKLRRYASKEFLRIEAEFTDLETDKSPVPRGFGAMIEYLRLSKSCRTIILGQVGMFPRTSEECALLNSLECEIRIAPDYSTGANAARSNAGWPEREANALDLQEQNEDFSTTRLGAVI